MKYWYKVKTVKKHQIIMRSDVSYNGTYLSVSIFVSLVSSSPVGSISLSLSRASLRSCILFLSLLLALFLLVFFILCTVSGLLCLVLLVLRLGLSAVAEAAGGLPLLDDAESVILLEGEGMLSDSTEAVLLPLRYMSTLLTDMVWEDV